MRFLLFDCTVPAVPQTRLNSASGTWDKTEICLRYRNRTLPWTLPPVPQVPLQLYGNQALKTTVLSLKYLINVALVVSLRDV